MANGSLRPGRTAQYVIVARHASRPSIDARYERSNDFVPMRLGATSMSIHSSKPAGPDPLDDGLHEHHVELLDPEAGAEAERRHEPGARVVEVGEPVRVEHDALPVDLRVAHTNAMDERRRRRRSPAQLGAVRRDDRVDRRAAAASRPRRR